MKPRLAQVGFPLEGIGPWGDMACPGLRVRETLPGLSRDIGLSMSCSDPFLGVCFQVVEEWGALH